MAAPETLATLATRARVWLLEQAFPLWTRAGIDPAGGFYEALTAAGQPAELPQRAMVQARQIYSFCLAAQLGALPASRAQEIVHRETSYLLRAFGRPDGAVACSIDRERRVLRAEPELYTQAFVIFALAQAYALTRESEFKDAAHRLVDYLRAKRRVPAGGFDELKEGMSPFQSNPHMHLLEATLAWMRVEAGGSADATPWRGLADDLVALARGKFIDAETGALGEHFDSLWSPIRDAGRFVFEPGHHYEWTWLLGIYQDLVSAPDPAALSAVRHRLWDLAEAHGLHPERRSAVDEVWSDFTIKKPSARFWPHCERIKAAVQLAAESPAGPARQAYARAADEALAALFEYLDADRFGLTPGLWRDTRDSAGEFSGEPVKSSSLYHIAGALHEYLATGR